MGLDDATVPVAPLLAAIERDRPAAIAAVDRGVRAASLLAPDGPPPFDVTPAGVTAVWLLRDGVPTLPARVLEAAGIHRPRARLPVNYLGVEGLPLLPADRVARGELPAGTFAGRIVLLGAVSGDLATALTPIGTMTAAEVQAHALLGADGADWAVLPGAVRWLLLVVLSVALLAGVDRRDETRALALLGAAAVVILIVDYLLFAAGWLLVGAAGALLALVLVPLVQAFAERRLLRRRLHDLRRDLRLRAELHSLRGENAEDERRFWTRVAELARLYIDCRSSIVAVLPPDRWHLSLRVITGATVGEIREKRRDIRRGSYRRAHLTLHPVWQDDFMSRRRGEKTLLTPLADGGGLVGFWILNFGADAFIDPAHLKLITALARQIALAIVLRRARDAALPEEQLERLLPEGKILSEIGDLAATLRDVAGDKKRLHGLIETAPCGLCVATLWGEVRSANAAMRAICSEEGLDNLAERTLAEVLIALTPLGKDEVDDALRSLVREAPELTLAGRPETGTRRAKYQVVLSWLPEEEDREKLLLVSVIQTRLATRAVRASDFQNEGTTQARGALEAATAAFDKADRTLPTQPIEKGELTEEFNERTPFQAFHEAIHASLSGELGAQVVEIRGFGFSQPAAADLVVSLGRPVLPGPSGLALPEPLADLLEGALGWAGAPQVHDGRVELLELGGVGNPQLSYTTRVGGAGFAFLWFSERARAPYLGKSFAGESRRFAALDLPIAAQPVARALLYPLLDQPPARTGGGLAARFERELDLLRRYAATDNIHLLRQIDCGRVRAYWSEELRLPYLLLEMRDGKETLRAAVLLSRGQGEDVVLAAGVADLPGQIAAEIFRRPRAIRLHGSMP